MVFSIAGYSILPSCKERIIKNMKEVLMNVHHLHEDEYDGQRVKAVNKSEWYEP